VYPGNKKDAKVIQTALYRTQLNVFERTRKAIKAKIKT